MTATRKRREVTCRNVTKNGDFTSRRKACMISNAIASCTYTIVGAMADHAEARSPCRGEALEARPRAAPSQQAAEIVRSGTAP